MSDHTTPVANILIVDDTIENLRLLAGLLGEHNYEVRPVTSGPQALEAAEREPPDLILLDINMPGMNGYEVCRAIKANGHLRDIPIVFLTALTSTVDKVKAFEAGGVDYITKPFQIEEVLARVKTHIQLRRALAERNLFLRQAQEATTAAESIHRAILESSLDSVVVMNSDGVIIEFNPAAEALFGYARDRAIGKTVASLMVPPELREAHLRGLKRYLETGISKLTGTRLELPAMCADGTVIQIELAMVPVPGSNPLLISAAIRDITQRKRQEAMLAYEARILGMIATGADLTSILTAIVESIEGIAKGTIASILFLDGDGAHLRHGIAPGLPEAYNQALDGSEIGPKAGSCGAAAHRRGLVIVTDLETDPLWEDYRELARLSGMRACWSTPIIDSRDLVIGTLAMYYEEPRSPHPDDLALIQRASHLAGVAMERKRAEDSLREAQDFNAQVLASTQHGLVVLDTELRYQIWNPAMEKITGLRAGEVLGRTPQEVFSFLSDAGVMDAMRRAIDGKTSHSEDFQYHVPSTGRQGWATDLVGPMRNSRGEIVGVINSVVEITERVHEERFVKTLMDSLPGSLYLFNSDGNLLKWNKVLEDATGYTHGEIAILHRFNLVPEDQIEPVRRAVASVLAEGHGSIESYLQTKDGRSIPYYYTGVRMNTEQGPCVLAIGIDITDRRQLENQFRQAQKMEAVGQLAGGIAHDFNNLLTIITGYCQLILRSMDPHEPLRDKVQEILRAGERSASLTRQLLTFSRKQVLAPKIMNLNDVVYDTEKMLHRLIGEDVQLMTSLHPQLDNVRADPGQIEQVLLNLAVNARDAMPQGGKLLIETKNVRLDTGNSKVRPGSLAGAYVMLSMSDTGTGMAEEIKQRIFEPFFTTKGTGKGTGLGMAVVHGIVEQSDGYIEVESTTGVGTAFKIYLPRSVGESQPKMAYDGFIRAPKGTETILLVEDEEMVRALSREVLQESGYKVLDAADGDSALRLSAEYDGPIHLLVTDVVMPGMGGLALSERIVEFYPKIKVLFVSGYTDDAVVRHGVFHEEVNFLQKPFSPDALAYRVRDVLDAG